MRPRESLQALELRGSAERLVRELTWGSLRRYPQRVMATSTPERPFTVRLTMLDNRIPHVVNSLLLTLLCWVHWGLARLDLHRSVHEKTLRAMDACGLRRPKWARLLDRGISPTVRYGRLVPLRVPRMPDGPPDPVVLRCR